MVFTKSRNFLYLIGTLHSFKLIRNIFQLRIDQISCSKEILINKKE